MINLTIGCNFDPQLIDDVVQLNSLSNNVKIKELYGSDKQNHLLTARPKYRLPSIKQYDFEDYIRRLKDYGLSFNYTMNAFYLGTKRDLLTLKGSIVEKVNFLTSCGVDTITISNPLLAEIIREKNSQVKIAISTIAHIDTVTQIKILNERYGISKVYNNILKNRSIKFLSNAQKYCNQNSIELTLIANEFCANTSTDNINTTHCVFRDSCFLCHSQNETKEDDSIINGFPMQNCISTRTCKSAWLKSHFIRPEDMKKYKSIGICSYKITGRTGTTKYIKTIAEAYIKEKWDGNLLSLWKPLETILSEQDELEFTQPISIENHRLNSFIDHWFGNTNHECANEICGETCRYCDDFAERIS
jgi:collagenase-like PrtC family protease